MHREYLALRHTCHLALREIAWPGAGASGEKPLNLRARGGCLVGASLCVWATHPNTCARLAAPFRVFFCGRRLFCALRSLSWLAQAKEAYKNNNDWFLPNHIGKFTKPWATHAGCKAVARVPAPKSLTEMEKKLVRYYQVKAQGALDAHQDGSARERIVSAIREHLPFVDLAALGVAVLNVDNGNNNGNINANNNNNDGNVNNNGGGGGAGRAGGGGAAQNRAAQPGGGVVVPRGAGLVDDNAMFVAALGGYDANPMGRVLQDGHALLLQAGGASPEMLQLLVVAKNAVTHLEQLLQVLLQEKKEHNAELKKLRAGASKKASPTRGGLGSRTALFSIRQLLPALVERFGFFWSSVPQADQQEVFAQLGAGRSEPEHVKTIEEELKRLRGAVASRMRDLVSKVRGDVFPAYRKRTGAAVPEPAGLEPVVFASRLLAALSAAGSFESFDDARRAVDVDDLTAPFENVRFSLHFLLYSGWAHDCWAAAFTVGDAPEHLPQGVAAFFIVCLQQAVQGLHMNGRNFDEHSATAGVERAFDADDSDLAADLEHLNNDPGFHHKRRRAGDDGGSGDEDD